jgi:glycosyltransferase involved in cell wall biosynthesis
MGSSRVPVSIVIPARNEERVIGRCLRALTDGADEGELDIVVAINGTTDGTAAAARAACPTVRIVEIAQGSKTAALNAGDGAAHHFPRFYVDADVTLGVHDVRKVAHALISGRALAAAPRPEFETEERPWAVRAFYDVWTRLPYFDGGMIGTGVFALSEEGRRRFGEFPPIIADDHYVACHFAPHERVTVEDASFSVRVPRNLRGILKIQGRARAGLLELGERYPQLLQSERKARGVAVRRIAERPDLWPGAVVYGAVSVTARVMGHYRRLTSKRTDWQPETSSREGATR